MARRKKPLRSDPRKRTSEIRESYDRVLMVCEGAKTEPNYLKEICRSHRISSANISILGEECGSDPQSVVQFAIDTFHGDNDFDRVYCLIDRDCHNNQRYNQAFNLARNAQLENSQEVRVPVRITNSVPCFEYWLLLHFVFTTAPFVGRRRGGGCDEVIRELCQNGRLPNYGKGNDDIYQKTRALVNSAISNSKIALTDARTRGSPNPSTNFHDLYEYLVSLNK